MTYFILCSSFLLGGIVMLVWVVRRCYRPITRYRREQLRTGVMRHYIEAKHVVEIPGGIILQARPVRSAPWLSYAAPSPAGLFFYTSRHGKGARLNHGRWKGEPYIRVDILGEDFMARVGAERIYWRPFDGAIAIFQDYVGPASLARGVSPLVDRTGA